jgi:hypothetical protein
MTAWFLFCLKADAEAAIAFAGKKIRRYNETKWQDIRAKFEIIAPPS